MNVQPAIYVGTLRHRRFQPSHHEFTYPVLMVCLDVDRIAEMMSISPFAGYNRWNWASFFDEDHFGNPNLSLRERLILDARIHSARMPEGKVLLLTNLRYFGYNFSPVSFFFCESASGETETIMVEVNNTFGETYNYWLSGSDDTGNSVQYQFRKQFHVSPFMDMNQQYDWTFASSGDSLIIQTNSFGNGRHIFDATLKLEAREWNRKNLHSTLLSYPCMTLKVITAIHWQAVRLWWKNIPTVHHPGPGKFGRSNVQHFAASWSVGATKSVKAEGRIGNSSSGAQPSPSGVAEKPDTTNYPRLEPQ